MTVFANRALLGTGWENNVRIEIENGNIFQIHCDAAPLLGDVKVDTLLPALANLHSHSFSKGYGRND